MGPPKPLERVRHAVRLRHDLIRTASACVDRVRRFILFNGKRHPAALGADEVAAFLTHLAVERGMAPSTQGQAKSSILFLFKVVLNVQFPWLDAMVAARNPRRLPVVLTVSDVRSPLDQI